MNLISGGQTGVDRAALDFCLENNIPCGGWCPKGRLAEDGIIPDKYPLLETGSEDYDVRTRLNIEDSDGTLIIYKSELDKGTRFTLKTIQEKGKPYFLINLSLRIDPVIVKNWVIANDLKTINIAGPRESNSPGIYETSKAFLSQMFK
jgi:hypothetical protein